MDPRLRREFGFAEQAALEVVLVDVEVELPAVGPAKAGVKLMPK